MKKYIVEGVAIVIDDKTFVFDSQVMENVDVCSIVVGKTTDCPT